MSKYGYTKKELEDLCQNAGISLVTYYNRRQNGASHEEALRMAKWKPKYGDKSIAKQCAERGICMSTYNTGMTHAEALAKPVRRYTERDTDKTVVERCKEAGISTYIYNKRRKMGLSKEEAISQPRKLTIKQQCDKVGISTSAYYKRIENGMSHEDAINLPKQYPRGVKQEEE